MDIVPLGPGFAAELRGVTLADIASGRRRLCGGARRVRGTFGPGVSRPGGDRRASARVLAPLRPAGSDQGRLAGHRLAFRDPHHHRPRRKGGAGRSPAGAAQQGQPALAYRQLVQAHAGADLDTVGAHHSGARRRNRIRLDPARLRAARRRHAQETRKLLCLARLRAFARQDRAGSRQPRGARGAAAAMLAHGVEEPGQRPRRALSRLACLCGRRHGRGGRAKG